MFLCIAVLNITFRQEVLSSFGLFGNSSARILCHIVLSFFDYVVFEKKSHTVQPRLSGLLGIKQNSPDNRKYEF